MCTAHAPQALAVLREISAALKASAARLPAQGAPRESPAAGYLVGGALTYADIAVAVPLKLMQPVGPSYNRCAPTLLSLLLEYINIVHACLCDCFGRGADFAQAHAADRARLNRGTTVFTPSYSSLSILYVSLPEVCSVRGLCGALWMKDRLAIDSSTPHVPNLRKLVIETYSNASVLQGDSYDGGEAACAGWAQPGWLAWRSPGDPGDAGWLPRPSSMA